jgi:hypothetical protein
MPVGALPAQPLQARHVLCTQTLATTSFCHRAHVGNAQLSPRPRAFRAPTALPFDVVRRGKPGVSALAPPRNWRSRRFIQQSETRAVSLLCNFAQSKQCQLGARHIACWCRLLKLAQRAAATGRTVPVGSDDVSTLAEVPNWTIVAVPPNGCRTEHLGCSIQSR